MQIKRTRKIEESGGFSEFEQSIKVKLVFRNMREGQLTARHKKWRVASKSRRLYLDQPLPAIGFER